MVWFTHSTRHEHFLLDKLKLDANTIYVFDKGYNDYKAFKKFVENQTGFVTRLKDNAVYDTVLDNEIDENIHSGVLEMHNKDWLKSQIQIEQLTFFRGLTFKK